MKKLIPIILLLSFCLLGCDFTVPEVPQDPLPSAQIEQNSQGYQEPTYTSEELPPVESFLNVETVTAEKTLPLPNNGVEEHFDPAVISRWYADCNEFISLRSEPSTSSSVITRILANEEFSLLG